MPFAMHQPTIRTEQFLAVMVFTVSRIKVSTVLALDNAVFAEIVKMQEQVLVGDFLETFVGAVDL